MFAHPGQEIPLGLASQYFQYLPNQGWGPLQTGKCLMSRPGYVGLVTTQTCYAGGVCEYTCLFTFDWEGTFLSKIPLEQTVGDCGFLYQHTLVYQSDSLLIVFEKDEDHSCEDEVVIEQALTLTFHPLGSDGRAGKTYWQKIDPRRKYYMFSCQLSSLAALRAFSPETRLLIRQEILAAHGYTFREAEWQAYFTDQAWYVPLHEAVTHLLSPIERHNLDLISQLE
ncbi:MAG: YARHG domain-containing protein [Bacteroidia bacterium]|nr:YARHG domain-containing protein [Bacteroidia bacterium]